MANRYDYGSFSRAASQLLKPIAQKMNFKPIRGTAFGRERVSWVDGFDLQQSAYGSGDFCINVGIHVPALDDLWLTNPDDRSFGLLIWGRLGANGIYSGEWYPAANKLELEGSIRQFEPFLQEAEMWFSKFQSMSDIAEEYKASSDLEHVKEDDHISTIAIINYGFLLLLAGKQEEAKRWLAIAHAQCQFVVSQNVAGFQRRKPGKEALYYHEQDLQQLKAVETALQVKF